MRRWDKKADEFRRFEQVSLEKSPEWATDEIDGAQRQELQEVARLYDIEETLNHASEEAMFLLIVEIKQWHLNPDLMVRGEEDETAARELFPWISYNR